MELTDILYEKKDGIAIATFNRPATLNAFRQATLHEFKSILDDVQADEHHTCTYHYGQRSRFLCWHGLERVG